MVKASESAFAVIGLDHGHIYAMSNGLLEAGAQFAYVYDEDPNKMEVFLAAYPQTQQSIKTTLVL